VNVRVVIADAGPLIALARIDSLSLLERLFGQVCITDGVRLEVLPRDAVHGDATILRAALDAGWIRVMNEPSNDWRPLNAGVDAGAAGSIHLALELQKSGHRVLLVIDDKAGRLEATAQGVALIGTAALIGLAKSEGLIDKARPLLERLSRSGYYIGRSVIEAVLVEVGE